MDSSEMAMLLFEKAMPQPVRPVEVCPGCDYLVYPDDTHCHCPPDADEREER